MTTKENAPNAQLERVAAELLDAIRARAESVNAEVLRVKSDNPGNLAIAAWIDDHADTALAELRWIRSRILQGLARHGDLRGS